MSTSPISYLRAHGIQERGIMVGFSALVHSVDDEVFGFILSVSRILSVCGKESIHYDF